MKTLIVGQRSNLTRYLDKKVIQSTSVISSQDILNNNFKRKNPKKFNLINLFYPSSKLDKNIDYNLFLT